MISPLHVGIIRIPVQFIFVKLRLHRYRVIIIDRRAVILNLMHGIRGGTPLCGASADFILSTTFEIKDKLYSNHSDVFYHL